MGKRQLKRVDANRDGILGVKKWLVGLQNLWDNNKDIYTNVLSNLPQPIRNNPWPMHLINQNYKSIFRSKVITYWDSKVKENVASKTHSCKRIGQKMFLT
jgi:hypothetical protein